MTWCTMGFSGNPDPIIVYPKPNSKYVDDTIYYSGLPICCFGLVNNLFVLWVLIKRQQSPHLTILKSMAFVDLCLIAFFILVLNFGSQSLPDTFLGGLTCRFVVSGFLIYFFSATSAWHVVILAVEFYGSSMESPWYTFFTKNKLRIRCSITVCWFIGFIISFNRLWNFHENNGVCYLDYKQRFSIFFNDFEEIIFILVVPLFIMVYCYWQIVKRLREAARFYKEKMAIDPTTQFEFQKVTKFQKSVMCRTSFIFAVYMITWMPIQAIYFMSLCKPPHSPDSLEEKYRFLTAQFLPMINSTLNPIVYSWTWFEFREEAYKLISRIRPSRKNKNNKPVNASVGGPTTNQPGLSLFDDYPSWNTNRYEDLSDVETISSD